MNMKWPWVSRRKMEQTRLWDYREMRSTDTYMLRCAAREGRAKGREAERARIRAAVEALPLSGMTTGLLLAIIDGEGPNE